MLNIYAQVGRLIYYLTLPLLRVVLRRNERSYLAIICQDEVLLVRNSLSAQRWQLPGGGNQASETAQQTVRREITEELGLTLDRPLINLSSGVMKSDQLGFKYHLFYCRLASKPQLKISKLEITSYCWQPLNSLGQINITYEIQQALLSLT